MKQVTDLSLLETLNTPVTDEALLSQLNAPKKEAEPWYEDLGEGLGVSGLGTYYGIKDLFGSMDEEDLATLEDWKKDAAESGWGTAGEILGDVAQLAVPGGAALKGAKALQKVKGLKTASKALPFVADAGASAGLEALQAEQGKGAEAASESLKGSLLGGALAKSAGKLLKGAKKTPEAQQIIDKGGFVTPGRATDSGLVQAAENIAAYTPFLARSVDKSRRKADDSWNEIILNEVAPIGTKITEKGQKGIAQIKQSFDDAYSNAWKGADNVSNKGRINFVNEATQAADSLGVEDLGVLKKVMTDFKKLSAEPSSKKIKELDNQMRKQIQRAGKDKNQLRDTLKNMRSSMREGMSNDTLGKLKGVDKQYAKYLVTRKAASKAADTEGVFTPKQLLQSAKQVGGETRTATGKAPLQDLATGGVKMAGKDLATSFLDPVRRLSKYAPTPVPFLEKGSQALIGETSTQKGLKATADLLRKLGVSGTTIGGSYAGDQ